MDAADFKVFISPLLFFKRMSDVYDEEFTNALAAADGDLDYASFAETHRFNIPEHAHWKSVWVITHDVGESVQRAMRAIERSNPDQLHGIFGDAQWTNKELGHESP